ncbi:MAG: UDP-N-acetylmuramoyl-L-alanyl-D-glutamate--2,6-diaminopimelate ligase [Armatimonadetes bacterium]|nr:UDP-N-acetylmuramoyl-L-alanyl-D-glutamate--2,6-diaminopimelate ligase [Armatimonadota bacterium]
MLFSDLVKCIADARVVGDGDADVTGVAYDSRQVEPGFVFVAMKGGSFDGHEFIGRALDAGASAIVAEREVDEAVKRDVPYVVVPNGRVAMGEIAAPLCGFPSRKMKLVGVTGTSGKTTVTHLIQGIFNAAGKKAGLIGTVGAKIGGEILDTKHTTPESADLQKLLSYMAEQGVEVVAMEVSSHGLYQGRSLGCEFDCGVFTNIARDHLDFHKTIDAYLDAKIILFRDHPKASTKRFHAVINADDPSAGKVREAAQGRIITFGMNSGADVTASDVEVTDKSVWFTMSHQGRSVPVRLGIGGAFNVYNALSAAGAAIALGMDLDEIARGLATAKGAPGRFESVECGQDFGVIVDYAHTPDEIENVMRTAKNLTQRKLIAVFGCGGDRDKGKRPLMGGLGAEIADEVIITSDNPRTEDPNAIIRDILAGILEHRIDKVTVQADRKDAIREAIHRARTGDIVVIAGKGHEDYQIFADRTIHFDDREVAREILIAKARKGENAK